MAVNINDIGLKDFQKILVIAFRSMLELEDHEVKQEWSSMLAERDLHVYSPRLDVAVGPFSEERGYFDRYDEIMNKENVKNFVNKLISHHRKNMNCLNIEDDDFNALVGYEELSHLNYNARCLIAVEIENKVSRKHLMGGAINASALGRLGIVLPWTQDNLKAFVRMIRYMSYLKQAQKNTFNTANILIVTKEQLVEEIEGNSTVNFQSLFDHILD